MIRKPSIPCPAAAVDEPVIAVVGTGAMGRGIAQIAATGGCHVLLYDADPDALRAACEFITRMLRRLVAKGRLSEAEAEAANARLQPVAMLAELAPAGLVIEAISESLEAKRALFQELESVIVPSTVLATNTSSLAIGACASDCRHPERVAGMHFFNPVPLMPLVEIVAGPHTAPEVIDSCERLGRRMGRTPVRCRDTPGFIVNHASRGFAPEAMRLVLDGIAQPQDNDRILTEALGFRMGPCEMIDLSGLDVAAAVMTSIYRQYQDEPAYRPSPLVTALAEAGLHGRKTGAGLYRYDHDGRRIDPPEPPAPTVLPTRVWVSRTEPELGERLSACIAIREVILETGERPGSTALCLITPVGSDCTSALLAEGLDPRRTLAVDVLFGLEGRRTLMTNPATEASWLAQAHALLAADGTPVTVIRDGTAFVAQRIIATMINVACRMAAQGIASPEDIDTGVRLGLNHPLGPFAWARRIGPARVLRILEGLQRQTGDPRYRSAEWLRRRAMLGLAPEHREATPAGT